MARLPYQEVRDLVEQHDGTMRFLRKRFLGGVWLVTLDGKVGIFPAVRKTRTEEWQAGHVGLNDLYLSGRPYRLQDNALELLINMLE